MPEPGNIGMKCHDGHNVEKAGVIGNENVFLLFVEIFHTFYPKTSAHKKKYRMGPYTNDNMHCPAPIQVGQQQQQCDNKSSK